MSVENFLDTNILVYLFDEVDNEKRETAEHLVQQALHSETGCISFQVVQETINVITRKLNAPPEKARQLLNHILTPLWRVNPTRTLYERGLDLQIRYRLDFYDSLIVAAASSRFRLLSVMRIGLVLAIIGQALATISPGPAVLGVGLFAQGLGGALTWIPAPVVTADAIAPERRGLAVGFLGAGMGLGVVFAGQLASIVRSTMGDASWRNVYFVQLIIGAVVAAVVLLFIGHRQERLASGTGIGGFSALRRVPGWVPMVSGFVIFGLLYLLVISFLTARLEDDSGWTSSQASLAFTLVGAAMIFGGPLFIALSDRIGTRWTLAMSFAGWAITTTLILPGWFVPTIFLSVAVGMLFAAMPTVLTVYVVSNTAADDYGPAFAATTFDGVEVSVLPGDGTAKVIGFYAHWCPHCQRELPRLADWLAANELPAGVEVIAVSTAVDPGRGNYPPSAWFEEEQWPAVAVRDSESNEIGNAYGLRGFPYMVGVDADGRVVARVSGELNDAAWEFLLQLVAP